MCVNGEEMLPIDRFIIDMGMLSYPKALARVFFLVFI